MDKTRVIFLGLIATSLVGVGIAAYTRYGTPATAPAAGTTQATAVSQSGKTTAKATAVPAAIIEPVAKANEIEPTKAAVDAAAGTANFAPIFSPDIKAEDGLPKFVCSAGNFGSHLTLAQIQKSGLDVKYDFHLGIVPRYLNDAYGIGEQKNADLVREGTFDCTIITLDQVADHNHGQITAVIDESAGADQIWARDLATMNDLKGKRIAFEEHGEAEYFINYILKQVGLTVSDVEFVPMATAGEALAAFNAEKADVVVGREPLIFDAEKSGGRMLISTNEFRPLVDVIVTNVEATQKRGKVVEHFHEAWFEALREQSVNFDKAAQDIAAWGNNDWTGISVDNAAEDFRTKLNNIAVANMEQNRVMMEKPEIIKQRLEDARGIWELSGEKLEAFDVSVAVNPEFVLHAVKEYEQQGIATNWASINNSFALVQLKPAVAASTNTTDTQAISTVTPETAAALPEVMTEVATLPCSRFEFIPNTTKLLPESQQLLDSCAVKTLKETSGVYMRVKASSAWPGPKGSFSQKQVEEVAAARAKAIADYLTSQGISADRFVIEFVLPPEERRETTDLKLQAQDRYVELALLVSGL